MAEYPEYSTNSKFNKAYWLSQPPEIRAMASLSDREKRAAEAWTLAMDGKIIDGALHVDLFDPWYTMLVRQYLGLKWVPSYLQPPFTVAQHVAADWPSIGKYAQDTQPLGSIKVSTNIEDYPPFDKPEVEAQPVYPPGPWMQIDENRWHVAPGDQSPAGSTYISKDGTYVLKSKSSPFGIIKWWTRVERNG